MSIGGQGGGGPQIDPAEIARIQALKTDNTADLPSSVPPATPGMPMMPDKLLGPPGSGSANLIQPPQAGGAAGAAGQSGAAGAMAAAAQASGAMLPGAASAGMVSDMARSIGSSLRPKSGGGGMKGQLSSALSQMDPQQLQDLLASLA